MSLRYNQKVNPFIAKNPSFYKKDRFDNVKIKRPAGVSGGQWVRPSDWLPMPEMTSSDEKIAMLMPIYDNKSNFLAILCRGAYTVDWGDGSVENVADNVKAQHQYDYNDPDLNSTVTSEGFKMAVVVITPQAGNNITLVNFNQKYASTGSTYSDTSPILEIVMSCPNLTSFSLGGMGSSFCKKLVSFTCYSFGSVTDLTAALASLYALREVNLGDSTQNVTNLTNIFRSCSALTNVSPFNTRSATSTSGMFALCSSIASSPLLDTTNVTNMSYMFFNCYVLESIPLFDTQNVTNMSYMFYFCYQLTEIPLFNTQAVTNMSFMFQGCQSLTKVPLFNTKSVTNMGNMFANCFSLITVPLFNTQSVTSMNQMFSGCYSLVTVPLFNTQSVTNMSYMFNICQSLATIPLFNTQSVTSMNQMFSGCSSLTTVPLFNTKSVTNMGNMFYNCSSLTTVPLFNTQSVTDMSSMFINCSSLTTVPLFNTQSVTTMSSMFGFCYFLTTVPLFNTQSVTGMSYMFQNCYALTTVPLFNTQSVTNMSYMFQNCYSLTTVPLFNTQSVTNMSYMFQNCYALTTVPLLPAYAGTLTSKFNSIFTGCLSLIKGALSLAEYSISYSGCSLSKESLEEIFDNLDTIGAASQTLTITSNWGAPTPVSVSCTTTAGSTTITTANTTGIVAGMQVTGTGTPLTTGRTVSRQATGDTVTLASHGLLDGDRVSFTTTAGGITANKIYYVRDSLTDTFKLALTPGGTAVDITADSASIVMKYETFVVSVVPNTSITVSRPMASSGTNTLAYRELKTGTAILKGWAVTG